MVHYLKAGSHITSTFSYLGAHRVHHLDVQKHSAERVLELVYAPERPGINLCPHCLQVRLYPEREDMYSFGSVHQFSVKGALALEKQEWLILICEKLT